MTNPFLTDLNGSSVLCKETPTGLELRLHPFETLAIPWVSLGLACYFGYSGINENVVSETVISIVLFMLSFRMFYLGRRKIFIDSATKEIKFLSGEKLIKKIMVADRSIDIQNTRIVNSNSEGPFHLRVFLFIANGEALFSVKTIDQTRPIKAAMELQGFSVNMTQTSSTAE